MKACVGDRMCLKQLINYAISVHRTGCTTVRHHLVKTNTLTPAQSEKIPQKFQTKAVGENEGFPKIYGEENDFS